MMKRILIATVAIFITWAVMDFVIHGVLLQTTYDATASMWRPMEEMNMPLMYLVTLVFTACFVLIYSMIEHKSLATGIKYGILFGIACRRIDGAGFIQLYADTDVASLGLARRDLCRIARWWHPRRCHRQA